MLNATTMAMLLYMASSSLLLVANKLAMQRVSAPSLVSVLQFATTSLCAFLLMACRVVPKEVFTLKKIRLFTVYAMAFTVTTSQT